MRVRVKFALSAQISFLLSSILTVPALSAGPCDQLLSADASSEMAAIEQVTSRAGKAVDLLLDPSVPDSLVKDFDYGVAPDPDTISYMRKHGIKKIPKDSLPQASSWRSNSDQPLILDSPSPRPDSRLAYFKGDLFSDSFYARHTQSAPILDLAQWKTFTDSQPWLEWSESGQKYIAHESGAAERIFEKIGTEKFTLYRGTVPQEFEFNQFVKVLNSNLPLEPNQLETLASHVNPDSHLGQALKQILADRGSSSPSRGRTMLANLMNAYAQDLKSSVSSGGLFVTTSRFKAGVFTKGTVISYSLSKDALARLLNEGKLYIGVEGEIEMAFVGPDSVQQLMSSETQVESVAPDGNMWNSDHPFPSIWR